MSIGENICKYRKLSNGGRLGCVSNSKVAAIISDHYIALNELYVDKESDSVFYIFKVTKAIYVHAIYSLVK